MPDKIITLDDHFSTGEPTVQLIATWGRAGKCLKEATSLHKVAAVHSPALDYIKTAEPEPGRTSILIIGLGDHETYGPNRNGDGFPSEPVPGKIAADQVLTKHYKSYENAHVFRHHVNDDPKKAIGRVKKAFWNPYMRRVEVIEDFEHAKAPDLLEKVAAGESLPVSMGCRIPYDVCTKCGNHAKTRKEYCDHLKYEMGKIASDGSQYAALNPSPNFFDSSFVLRPADRTGYTLMKVADTTPYELQTDSYSLGELAADLKEKAATVNKVSEIEKIINGKAEESVSNLDEKDTKLLKKYKDKTLSKITENTEPLSVAVMKITISHKPGDVLKTTEDLGMPLSLKELIPYFMGRMTKKESSCDCGDTVLKIANQHVPLLLNIFSNYPRFYTDLVKEAQLDKCAYNGKLAQQLAPHQDKRMVADDYLYRRMVPTALRGRERALTDMVNYVDPATGQRLQTNYGTVQKTHDALAERAYKQKALKSIPLLGASTLLGGAALLGRRFGMSPRKQMLSALGALGAGGAGAHTLLSKPNLPGPKVMSDQGQISGWTEMVPKRASVELAPEIEYSVRRGIDGPTEPVSKTYMNKFMEEIKTAEIYDEHSSILGPTLNLDLVAKAIGKSIIQRI